MIVFPSVVQLKLMGKILKGVEPVCGVKTFVVFPVASLHFSVMPRCVWPDLLYLIVAWYRKESEEEKNTFGIRFMYLTKIVMSFAVSVLITSLGCGLVFLFMAMVIAGICCLLKSIKEVRACKES